MRYFLKIAYDGSNYSGWQRQNNVSSIQQTLEESIAKVLKTKVTVIGCGRTDAGVHATQYIAHINTQTCIQKDFKKILNHILPNDIKIQNIGIQNNNPVIHSQKHAIKRTYIYKIHTNPDPFKHNYSAYYPYFGKNKKLIQEMSTNLIGIKDMRSFCKQPNQYKNTDCCIYNSHWKFNNNINSITFTISSNRFLRGMIRLLIGQFILLDQNKISSSTFLEYLNAKIPLITYNYAYPQGLYLDEVLYPIDLFSN